MESVKGNRYGRRDATMIFVAYRHGLRAAELVELRWDQIDFRRRQREQEPKSPFVFTSERDAPFSTAGFARMIERAGARSASRRICTCCAMPAATRWLTKGTTSERYRPISGTRIFSTQCAIPN
jgi:integrase